LKPLAGLAVAASVAVVAVLAVQQARAPTPGTAQVATTSQPAQSQTYVRVQGTRWQAQPGNVQAPQVDNRLNEYLVNHSEYAASGGMPGMLPYVRVVGYDQE
jgi:sigma-E factor negative regulatory protein RseA